MHIVVSLTVTETTGDNMDEHYRFN